jgi:hypothetical protein
MYIYTDFEGRIGISMGLAMQFPDQVTELNSTRECKSRSHHIRYLKKKGKVDREHPNYLWLIDVQIFVRNKNWPHRTPLDTTACLEPFV